MIIIFLKIPKKKTERIANMRLIIKNKNHDFIIDYFNNKIIEEYGYQKMKFRKIKYEKIISLKNEDFFKLSLKSFLKFDITPKCKNHSENENEIKLEFLSKNKRNKNIINLLENSLAYFYKNYFLNKKEFEINENEKLILKNNENKEKKNKIVYFDDFIEQLRKKNENEIYIEKIKKIAKEDFINYYYKIENKIFYIQKIKK